MAWNGISSSVCPWYAHALRNRMCAKQMEPHVKRAARPDNARSQLKTISPVASKLMYPNSPHKRITPTENVGRPARSMYVKTLGA